MLDDATSQITEMSYNAAGNVLSRTDPLGRRTSLTYASNGIDLLEVRNTTGGASDLVTEYASYTGTHRPESATDAAGQTTAYTYNTAGQVLTATNAKDETTTYAYNTGGQLLSVTGPVTGATASYTYDTQGRVRTVTDADGYVVTHDYDVFNRLTKTTFPDSTYAQWTYDRLDLASARDRLGRVTRSFHDPLRRLTATSDPLGRTVQQVWCACGSLDRLIDGNGHVTSWEYDLQGRATSETREGSRVTAYTYETTTSRVKTKTDPQDQVTTYTYFLDDQVKDRLYTDEAIATADVSFTYDAAYGRVATMVDGTGTTTYAYRALGTLGALQVATIDGPQANDVIGYTYDELGRVTGRTLNGVGAAWTRDALGRIESEVNPLGTFAYGFDGATSRPLTVTYPNSQTTTYAYFTNAGDRRLQTLHHQSSGSATLSKFDYTYNAAGEILTWRQQAETTATRWAYGYDLGSQLVSAVQRTDALTTVAKRYAYGYDRGGNRTTEQIDDLVTGAAFNGRNELTTQQPSGAVVFAGTLSEAATVTVNGLPAPVQSDHSFRASVPVTSGSNTVTVVATDGNANTTTQAYALTSSGAAKTFTYDDTGNLTSDGTRTFEWDAENRLVAVTTGTHRSEFSYDGLDRRVRIVEKTSGTTTRDARLFWVGTTIIEERLSTGEINRYPPP
ncbi:MAG: hypothetical protein ABMA15_14595 [Vicinamibacterales bacterium]